MSAKNCARSSIEPALDYSIMSATKGLRSIAPRPRISFFGQLRRVFAVSRRIQNSSLVSANNCARSSTESALDNSIDIVSATKGLCSIDPRPKISIFGQLRTVFALSRRIQNFSLVSAKNCFWSAATGVRSVAPDPEFLSRVRYWKFLRMTSL